MINHIPPKCLSEQREHSESFGYTHIETHWHFGGGSPLIYWARLCNPLFVNVYETFKMLLTFNII